MHEAAGYKAVYMKQKDLYIYKHIIISFLKKHIYIYYKYIYIYIYIIFIFIYLFAFQTLKFIPTHFLKPIANSDSFSKIHANHGGDPTQKRGRQKQRIEPTTASHNVKPILETKLANLNRVKPFHITTPPPKGE